MYGLLYQAARTASGTAGMGGNGQFHRLATLDAIADEEAGGPWRDRLTEDQDLGLRLIEAGWRGVAEARTTVDQQGLPSLRRLYRQRTRWAQGNLQAMSHLGAAARADVSLLARVDLLLYLLQPVLQAIVGVAFVVGIGLAVFQVAGFASAGLSWQLGFFLVLGYGGVVLGCLARGAPVRRHRCAEEHPRRPGLCGVLVAHVARAPGRGIQAGNGPGQLGEDCAGADRGSGRLTLALCQPRGWGSGRACGSRGSDRGRRLRPVRVARTSTRRRRSARRRRESGRGGPARACGRPGSRCAAHSADGRGAGSRRRRRGRSGARRARSSTRRRDG